MIDRSLTDLFPTLDPDGLSAAVTTHVLELADAREKRKQFLGPNGKGSEPITIRVPADLAREVQAIMHERNCTRNAAFVQLLRLGAKSRVSIQSDLPTPRELFKKSPAECHERYHERRDAEARTERVQALTNLVMAPDPDPKPSRGLFAL